jgi:dihydrofolate synthase/folylpolyglutamate synthase
MAPQPFAPAAGVIRERAAAVEARLIDVEREYTWEAVSHDLRGQDIAIEGPEGRTRVRLPLLGAHQAENAATAVACIEALRRQGAHIPDGAVSEGLSKVRWPGRLEVLREAPLVIADGAHNRDSARRLREALSESFAASEVTFIVGSSSDKDIAGLAAELAPVAGEVLSVSTDHPRAMPAPDVAQAFEKAGVKAKVVDNVGTALAEVLAKARTGGVICLTGSLFVAAEGREYLGIGKREDI